MAWEADCGGSMVLEALHVARTAGSPVPATSRSPCNEGLRNSATPTGDSEGAAGDLVAHASRVHAAGTAAPQDMPESFAMCGAGVSRTKQMAGIPNSRTAGCWSPPRGRVFGWWQPMVIMRRGDAR